MYVCYKVRDLAVLHNHHISFFDAQEGLSRDVARYTCPGIAYK